MKRLTQRSPRPNKPNHRSKPGYYCHCTGCDQYRAWHILPGSLCIPATHDPALMAPGTTPAWLPDEWVRTGWDFRLEDHGIHLVTVIGDVNPDDRLNGGRLGSCYIITHQNPPKILVTIKYGLVTLT